jgi:hypothetical protein
MLAKPIPMGKPLDALLDKLATEAAAGITSPVVLPQEAKSFRKPPRSSSLITKLSIQRIVYEWLQESIRSRTTNMYNSVLRALQWASVAVIYV